MVAKKSKKPRQRKTWQRVRTSNMFAAPGFIVQKGGLKGGGGLQGGGGVSYLGQQEPAFRKGCKMEKKHTHTNTRTTNTADCAHVNPPVRRLYPFRFLARPALCESIKVSGRIKNELSCERYFVTATGGSTRN